MTPLDEKQIMNQLNDPKTRRRAFEQLVNQYSEQLYWQVRRIVLSHDDANDVLQNVFLKAWSKLDTFHQDSKISTWLYRIALNESLDFMRKKKTQMVSTDDDEMTVRNTLMADEYFSGTEVEAMLQEAIAQLPDVQRTVFNMRYFDDMKYSEISEILQTSEGSLKASYHIIKQYMMIEEEKHLRETVGTRNAFRVPEGYFEQFTAQVMEQLPEQQKARTTMLRPWLYAAACTVVAVLMGVTYYWHQNTADDMMADSNYYEEVADYAMIDNIDIYACLADNE